MINKKLHRKIKNRKLLLNFLLYFFYPSNKVIILLSKNLDKFILEAQHEIYYNSLINTIIVNTSYFNDNNVAFKINEHESFEL